MGDEPNADVRRLRRLFEYDAWANREALASLSFPDPPARAVEAMAHVLAADRLWIERLAGTPQTGPVWPRATPEAMRAQADDVARRFEELLGRLDPAAAAREIEYVNTRGERWRTAVVDVLDHVLLHSAYHRGQVASHVRASGREPATTDFVHAVRQGLLERGP
jgi:uncharacterized damage-inducible protein DinB